MAASARAFPIAMDPKDVLALALGFGGTPWTVVEVRSDPELKRLNIEVDFPPGSRFPHPESGPCGSVIGDQWHPGRGRMWAGLGGLGDLAPAWSIRSANCANSAKPSTCGTGIGHIDVETPPHS